MRDAPPRRRRRHRHRAQRREAQPTLLIRMLMLCGIALGLGLILYPTAATWLSDQALASQLTAYETRSADLGDSRTQDLLDKAKQYNARLPYGELRDPYSASGEATTAKTDDDYEQQLRVAGLDVMSQVTIPGIRLSLPVFHGTSPRTLDKGAGHLFGSSLPVGGPGTHAVLTAHSGLVEATMFTDLEKVQRGDVFTVTTLGEVLYYRVDRIMVVKPDDIRALIIVPGKDYVTLVTCTPVHVNTHRLLVRGERIPAPDAATAKEATAAASVPFPWWIVVAVAGLGSSACYCFLPRRRRRRTPSKTAPTSVAPAAFDLLQPPVTAEVPIPPAAPSPAPYLDLADPAAPTRPTAVQPPAALWPR